MVLIYRTPEITTVCRESQFSRCCRQLEHPAAIAEPAGCVPMAVSTYNSSSEIEPAILCIFHTPIGNFAQILNSHAPTLPQSRNPMPIGCVIEANGACHSTVCEINGNNL